MTRYYLLLTMMMLSTGLPLFGQGYVPLLSTNKTWDELYSDVNSITGLSGGGRLWVAGDSVLNGRVYQQIRRRAFYPLEGPVFDEPYGLTEATFLWGLIREDTAARQVFVYDQNEPGEEFLAYDFSLLPGDTLWYSDWPFILDTIQPFILNNGDIRQQFFFRMYHSPPIEYGMYIEGIGGETGLFHPMDYPIGPHNYLHCVAENGDFVYGANCETYVLRNHHHQLVQFKPPYPNPTNGPLQLELP
ncbi:MAG: hypothetical protein KDC54_14755, partial [Lewinella sp.]|nr:hypothetical protein [Lewinella sp.]